jgi:phenylacetate-coenzyme A ligase PaaK-like adenylate-forming protein
MAELNEQNYFLKLLGLTISNSLNIPFYSQRWSGDVEKKVKTPEDLRLLPLITKEELIPHMEDPRSFPQSPDVSLVYHTSGTTGKPFYRFRTREEVQFFHDFLNAEKETRAKKPGSETGLKPVILTEGSFAHGGRLPIDHGGLSIHSTADKAGLSNTIEILTREFKIPGYTPGVKAIVCSVNFAIQTAMALYDKGIDPKSIGVEVIHTKGNFCTARNSRYIEESWGTIHFDYFSLSEIMASAPCCRSCGNYSFKPTVIAEFLDPVTREPVKEGLAVLVLTELFPYVRYHPLVRYWTDDLVWLSPAQGCCGKQPFMPKGRLKCAIKDTFVSPGKILVTDCEIYEAMQEIPEVVFSASDEWVWLIRTYGMALRGLPRLNLELVKKQRDVVDLVIKFECCYSPLYYQDEAKGVERRLKKKLLEISHCLREAVASKKYRLILRAVPRIENPYGL